MRSLSSMRVLGRATVLALVLSSLSGTAAIALGHETLVSVTDTEERILGENSLRDVSDDGRFVLFGSDSDSITAQAPGPFESYLCVRDRQVGSTTLVAPANVSIPAGVSNDGSIVAFSTEHALTTADTNGLEDVYVVGDGRTPQLVSTRGGVVHTTGAATDVVVSGDGSLVAFTSYASGDLTAGDTPGLFRRNGMIAQLGSGVISRIPFPPIAIDDEVGSIRPLELSNDGSRVLVSAFVTGPDDLGRPTLRDVLYVWNRQADQVLVVDDAPYSLSVVSRVHRFSPDGLRIHVVTSGPAASLEQAISVITIDAATGATLEQSSFEAPESLYVDPDATTPVPATWRSALSADGKRVALHQSPWGDTVWVHDLGSGESIAQAAGFPPSIGLFEFRLTADGSTLVFERPTTDTTLVVDLLASEVGPSVFADTGDSIFRQDILWLFDRAITEGCTPAGTEFCPDDPVTRGQMAAFLSRALDLPPSDLDTFDDDDGSIFEADIQAIAAADITIGCDPDGTAFCPDDPVTRGQMASFVARALGLPAGDVDRFTDDDGSIFEADIQAIAAAGVTRGCDSEGTLFCPDDFLTRGQMAAILHRAFGDSTLLP